MGIVNKEARRDRCQFKRYAWMEISGKGNAKWTSLFFLFLLFFFSFVYVLVLCLSLNHRVSFMARLAVDQYQIIEGICE